MKRLILHKTAINHLKEKIANAEEKKKELKEYIKKLYEKYSKREISYSFYIETLYRRFEGKDIHEWIEHFDDYIKDCRKRIKRERGALALKQISILIFAVVILASVIKDVLTKS